jgi:hypothetical protein
LCLINFVSKEKLAAMESEREDDPDIQRAIEESTMSSVVEFINDTNAAQNTPSQSSIGKPTLIDFCPGL